MGIPAPVFVTGPEAPIHAQASGLAVSYVAASACSPPTVWWTLGAPARAAVDREMAEARARLGCATGPLRIDARFIGEQQRRADALARCGEVPRRVDVAGAVPPATGALAGLL